MCFIWLQDSSIFTKFSLDHKHAYPQLYFFHLAEQIVNIKILLSTYLHNNITTKAQLVLVYKLEIHNNVFCFKQNLFY